METIDDKKKLQVMSELVARMRLASQLGIDTYGGDRDIYEALGYKKELNWQDYTSRYTRHDIAKAIIDRPVKASWKGEISIIETVKSGHTPFEVAWETLFNKLKLKSVFIRADKLTGIGRYSVIFLGLNDVRDIDSLRNPVTKSKSLSLLYVKPLSEQNAGISEFETDTTSERFGLPKMYTVNVKNGTANVTAFIHYTRIVHLVEDVLEDETYGTPRLQAVYNRLVDLEKLIGGDAEMFWRGARPGYTGEVNPDYQMGEDTFDELKSQIDEFENNLRRILVNEGVTLKALEQQIADPINHVDVQMQMISAVTGIPKRILTGSERGELSSAQDKLEWIAYVTSRREEQNEPMILRPFIDKCVEIGVIPKPTNPYIVVWDKLFSLSDKEKVEIGEIRSKALKNFTESLSMEIIPIDLFLEYFLSFDKTQIMEVVQKLKEVPLIEVPVTEEEDEIVKEEEKPVE